MMKRMTGLVAPAALAAVAFTAPADAARVDLDVNGIHVQANGTFDSNYTGTLDVSEAMDTQLVSIFVNGSGVLDGDRDAAVNGSILLDSGQVMGGLLTLVVDGGDSYTASIQESSGQVVQAIDNNIFQLGGLTYSGQFNDADNDGLFAGVDLNGIDFGAELPGNFLLLDYAPDASGADIADIEFRAVPLPAAALLGAPLVLGLPILRRTLGRFSKRQLM